MKQFDMVVIGSGAGLMVMEAALSAGLSCALVEKGALGGTCLNRGCIPSKVLVYPADLIRETEHAKHVGLNYTAPTLDWETIAQRMWAFINKNKKIESNLQSVESLTLYRGTAQFTGPKTIQVPDEQNGKTDPFEGKFIVVAAGARTRIPPVKGLEETGYVTSETFFGPAFPDKPWKSLVIVGGGAIGLEFAHIFSAYGTHVTLVEMEPRLAPTEEVEISDLVEKQFTKDGIEVFTHHRVQSVTRRSDKKELTLLNLKTNTTKTVLCEELLLASGVQSNADKLQVERAGIETDSRGYIITNQYLETNQKNIWALGDINGLFQFRHKANMEAEILVHNLFQSAKKRESMSYHAVPWAIFTHPQVAHAGLREDQIRARGIRYQVGFNHYSDVAKGYAMGYAPSDDDNGFVKLIVDENRKILGVHIVGPHAAILIQSFVYLMSAGYRCPKSKTTRQKTQRKKLFFPRLFPPCLEAGTLDPLTKSMVIHPALSEVAAWVIENLEWVD